jgi:hypothetical protein
LRDECLEPGVQRTTILKTRVVAAATQLPYLANVAPDARPGMTLLPEPHAVVDALPAGCKPATKSGTEYQNCGGIYDR